MKTTNDIDKHKLKLSVYVGNRTYKEVNMRISMHVVASGGDMFVLG